MAKVVVVYFSATGNTRSAAQLIVEGCESVSGSVVSLLEITGEDITEGRWQNDAIGEVLDSADAIILGTPTYMGSTSAQFKSFMDAMAPRWYTATWMDKIAAGFTVSSLTAGDKLNALTDLVVFAMQMGMVWCGTGGNFSTGINTNGFYLGAGLQSLQEGGFSESDEATARHLGARVATLASK